MVPRPDHMRERTEPADRLLHRAHVLNIKGRSYRLRDLEDALKA
jgi:DNA replication protein DnaC